MGPEPWKPLFLQALRDEMSVTHAVAKAGIGRTTAYRHREQDKDFAEAWDECWTCNVDELEASAFKRAKDGWDEPVWHNGKQCGVVRRYDNRLTWNFLQKWRAERYADAPTEVSDLTVAWAQAMAMANRLTTPPASVGTNGSANGNGHH